MLEDVIVLDQLGRLDPSVHIGNAQRGEAFPILPAYVNVVLNEKLEALCGGVSSGQMRHGIPSVCVLIVQ